MRDGLSDAESASIINLCSDETAIHASIATFACNTTTLDSQKLYTYIGFCLQYNDAGFSDAIILGLITYCMASI